MSDSNSSKPKFGRWTFENNALLEASGLVFSDIGASQASDAGFYVTGSLYFNEGSLQFENGRCRFYVKEATLAARCHDASFEPPTIAFQQKQRDSRTIEMEAMIETSREGSASANASGEINFRVPWGIAAGLGAGARAELSSKRSTAEKGVETTTIVQSLVWANIRSTEDISWRIQADPTNSVIPSGFPTPVLVGTRLLDSADGSLAYVRTSGAAGECSLSLEVRHVHIVITDFEGDGVFALRDLAGEIVRGRDKKAVVGRMALQKALEGSISLGTMP